MEMNSLRPSLGSNKNRKRIGRGTGSGHGKTATKGHKGQKARSGGSIKAGFEGGQMPLQRRLPKRGFTPLTHIEYTLVNIGQLDVFEAGSVISLDLLLAQGLAKSKSSLIKILGDGDITKPFTITASKFSKTARDKIIAAGGTIEEIV